MIFKLSEELFFPPSYLAREDGLLAFGGDLSVERLLLAYSQGIFPWYTEADPILWWSPDPRLVLVPEEFHLSKRLARIIRQNIFSVTFDTDFEKVITVCAEPRGNEDPGTWIVPEMIEAYIRLHKAGYAHSVECRQQGELVGGLYGVSLGRVFYGESMFSRVSNSSKVAFVYLVQLLRGWDFSIIDCQVKTEHLKSLGAKEIPGYQFNYLLDGHIDAPNRRGKWTEFL